MLTINAILLIWEHLKVSHEFKFLLTRRLNTDPIENFFGSHTPEGIAITRHLSNLLEPLGSCSLAHFLIPLLEIRSNEKDGGMSISKTLFPAIFFIMVDCDDDLDNLLAECTGKKRKLAKVPVLVAPPPKPNTLEIGPTGYNENSVSSSLTRENAIAYVSGYLLKKCFTKHQCETCKAVLVSHELGDSRKLLCFFKAYETRDVDPFGGLNAPTIPYLEYVTQLENVFFTNFSIFIKSSCVDQYILSKLKAVPVPFQTCPDFPLEFLQKLSYGCGFFTV